MALTVSSPRIFNENLDKQTYTSNNTMSIDSKCSCCPYGYHIDLDFVEYCEAVAAGNTDRNTIERRKKRERRRQCQSMEILLGLVSPSMDEIDNQLLEPLKNESTADIRELPAIPRSDHVNTEMVGNNRQTALDLSDVVGDFEATFKRLTKSTKRHNQNNQNETSNGISVIGGIHNGVHADFLPTDCDAVSIGSGNSNLSTGTLQNIREQMAVSLERMKELEEQVKTIPMLQVQVSVLKEEKRNLQKQVEDFTNCCSRQPQYLTNQRLRSQSLSTNYSPKFANILTREIGTMCGVMTRDVGVSHQQVRTRDIGMVTSTPIQPSHKATQFAAVQINQFDINPKKHCVSSPIHSQNISKFYSPDTSSLSGVSQYSEISDKFSCTSTSKIKLLNRSQIKLDNIYPNVKEFKDLSTNTEKPRPKRLTRSKCHTEEIVSLKNCQTKQTRTCGTDTTLTMHDIHTSNDISRIIEDSIEIYRKSINNNKKVSTKSTQCVVEIPKVPRKRNQETQVIEPFIMKLNVGVTAKPRTIDIGIDTNLSRRTKSVATSTEPNSIVTQTVSLNSLNSRSHSFNYGDRKLKNRTTKSVGSTVDGLIKTSSKNTDTTGLKPKLRDFGTSPMKKTYVDVSVGDSLKPHISISCAANYCDNCKETIKSLAKQISNNSENNYRNAENQMSNIVSRIPRPSHIPLNTPDIRRQFKRQDTYTKIPIEVIHNDVDSNETYTANHKHQQSETNEKKVPKEICLSEKEINIDDKTTLPESALFEPIREKSHDKQEPSKEMRAAMKVLNDNLKKSPSKNISHQTKNATNVIQQEWFKISSTATANPHNVEDYLDCFEEHSSFLLEYIVNMTDSSGNTAMHYAVSHGNFDVVSILLDSKVCDINKVNAAGYTAVMLAALVEVRNSTHSSVANRLFQLADVNIRAKQHGQTALMLAVSHGRKDMTRLLLDAGAAVNIQDEDGSTALMCAAEHGHTDIVRLLLANPDCDSSIVDVDGSSALKIALEAGNRDIGVLLYAHEHVNRSTSPYSSIRRSRRGSKSTTPTVPSPSTPTSPAPSKRFHSLNSSLTASKHSAK